MLSYLVYAVYFLIVDILWIQSFVLPTYQTALQGPFRTLSGPQDIGVALFVYALLLVGNVVFSDIRSSGAQSLACMLMTGAFLDLWFMVSIVERIMLSFPSGQLFLY